MMSLSKFIGLFGVLLILNKCDAWTFDADSEQNYTHHVAEFRMISGNHPMEKYNKERKAAMLFEESKALGSDLVLSADEIKANKVLMKAKAAEYEEGLKAPRKFAPSKHLFAVLDKVKESKLFKIISDMPKGGILHTHSSAMGSTDFLIKLTNLEHLWCCNGPEGLNVIGFQFSKNKPKSQLKKPCNWLAMAELKNSKGQDNVDNHLRERLSLYPKTKYEDNNEVWHDFEGIFDLLSGLLGYAPARKQYFQNALEEFHKDNVQYAEIRTSLSVLYDLDGKEHNAEDTLNMYKEVIKAFRKREPSFIGCKLIISIYRGKNDEKLKAFIADFYKMKKKFPGLIAGFDLVGQEEMGRPLIDMVPKLLAMQQKGVRFYFHAGETNWFGSTVDENLLDAILLGTKRIGHGYAVIKHPMVLKMLKEKDIAVEINPISNQVLMLVNDLRNHPAAYLFSHNYPVVVSSDDPSFWKASPLSHDFYVAFLGIASAHADLKFLKKLALNSIKYSAMTEQEQSDALQRWHPKWHAFITNLIK